MSNRLYDFTLAAAVGAAQRVDALGGFLKVIAAPGGAIGVKLDGGAEIQLLEGQGVRLPDGQQFREVTVRNLQAVANAGSIFIGDSRFEDSRITGVVSVIDGGRARTLAGQAFVGYVSVTGSAGCVPVVELFNNFATGVRTVIKALRLSTPTAGVIQLSNHNATLAQGPFDPQNKRLNGATSIAKLYRDPNLAASPGVAFESLNVGAGLVVPITLQEPIILDPGRSLVVSHQTLATTILATFEFIEEPNT